MANEKKVPDLRFNGFSDEWIKRKLSDVSIYSNGGSYESYEKETGRFELITLKSVNMDGFLVSSQRFIDIDVQTLHKGTLVMILSEQSPGLLGMTTLIPKDKKYVLNQRVAEILPSKEMDSHFLSMVINRNQPYFGKRGTGSKVQNISKPTVEGFEFYHPELLEQSFIGRCFNSIDDTITQKKQQHENIQNIKKSMLEKMFPKKGANVPEIRFDGFSGEWEEKKVKELFSITRGQVLAMIKTVENQTASEPYPVYSSQTKNNGLMGYYSEYLFENAITWTTDGAFAGTVKFRQGKFYSTNVNGVLLSAEGYANNCVAYALSKVAYGHVTRGGNPKLMSNVMSEIEICIPITLAEQIAIGNFFHSLDTLIEAQQEELERLQNIKKALLDKMFV